MALVVAGGVVVTAAGRFEADVRIVGSHIAAVGEHLKEPGDTVLDSSGCFVLPGAIDPHTHIEMPAGDGFNADTWYTGTVAAAVGGTTTVIDMITPERGGTLAAALADWRRRADPQAVIDFGFHMGLIEDRPAILAEVPDMVRAGLPSFKLYLAYPHLMLSDQGAFAALRAIGKAGGMALVHAENGPIIDLLVADAIEHRQTEPAYHAHTRPPATEAEATARACRLAEVAGTPLYIVHVSCREALAEIQAARTRGQQVLAETCTHYLLLSADSLATPDFADASAFVLSPPLRAEAERQALWQAVYQHQIDVIASDHCPWTYAQRERGAERFDRIPGGAPGVEERLPFLYTYGVAKGRLSLEELVALTATAPARHFGLFPRKGTIAPGADADLVVWDPRVERVWSALEHHSATDQTPYENKLIQGAARHVLVRGQSVIRDEALAGEAGFGQFLPRASRGPRRPPLR